MVSVVLIRQYFPIFRIFFPPRSPFKLYSWPPCVCSPANMLLQPLAGTCVLLWPRHPIGTVCVLWPEKLKRLTWRGGVSSPSEMSLSFYLQRHPLATARPCQSCEEATGRCKGMQGQYTSVQSRACAYPSVSQGIIPSYSVKASSAWSPKTKTSLSTPTVKEISSDSGPRRRNHSILMHA